MEKHKTVISLTVILTTHHRFLPQLLFNPLSFSSSIHPINPTATMQFTTPVLTLLLAAFSTAAPTDLVERQGGVFVAVGNKYNAGGCTGTALGDPIFGNGNVCQPLDRFGDGAPIVSYKLLSASAGCNGKSSTLSILRWFARRDAEGRD